MMAFLNRPALARRGVSKLTPQVKWRLFSWRAVPVRNHNNTQNVNGTLYQFPFSRTVSPSSALFSSFVQSPSVKRKNDQAVLNPLVRNFSVLSTRISENPCKRREFRCQRRLLDRLPSRQFHCSSVARYDRLQALEDTANRDRHNANAQAVFLQVVLGLETVT